MTDLSPGVASHCFDLLALVDRRPIAIGSLVTELPRVKSFDMGELVRVAQRLDWLRANEQGNAIVTPRGKRILAAGDEPLRLRQALLDVVEICRPPWVAMAAHGRERVVRFAPDEIEQCLREAELVDGYEDDVVCFWDRLAAIARGDEDIVLSEIGRVGERLTLAFEQSRTGRPAVWRAIESNSDGFDVLSVASSTDHSPLPIEVKASTMGLDGVLHITRHEWDVTATMPLHQFHLWNLRDRANPRLAIVTRSLMSHHVPINQGSGAWESVAIPFRAFTEHFSGGPAH